MKNMRKIIFYSVLSFENLMIWCVIYHGQLTSHMNFAGSLETFRVTTKKISLTMAIVFSLLLAYECFKKEKKRIIF